LKLIENEDNEIAKKIVEIVEPLNVQAGRSATYWDILHAAN
jgi:hypothetical protein